MSKAIKIKLELITLPISRKQKRSNAKPFLQARVSFSIRYLSLCLYNLHRDRRYVKPSVFIYEISVCKFRAIYNPVYVVRSHFYYEPR